MTVEARERLRIRYLSAFGQQSWRTQRASWFWIETEVDRDALAAPLASVVENGGCAYAYGRDDFPGAVDPASLRELLRRWHDRLTESLHQLAPTSEAEATDLASMLSLTREMWEIVELALEIEQSRWAEAA